MRSKTLLIGAAGVVIGVLLSAAVVFAGNLNPPAGPTDPTSQMYTLEQIYTRLTGGGNAVKMTSFTEPSSGPTGGTMHTLDDIYALAWPARVPKTGQTTSYATGDDGDLERGVAWPNPRFTDNGDGTVTDNMTGLIWLKKAACIGETRYAMAMSFVAALANGQCGLTDGSSAGDWRLPNLREMHSLIDYEHHYPALPDGHPFTDLAEFQNYFTTTTINTPQYLGYVWYVGVGLGDINGASKLQNNAMTWPVRGGQ